MTVLLKLLLAHMVGDFFLQPQQWVEEKELKRFRSVKIYIHILIHGALVALLLRNWQLAIAVMVVHGCIDLLKISFQKEHTKRSWFFVDQALHLISLIVLYFLFTDVKLSIDLFDEKFIALITSIVFLTFPCAYLIKMIVSKWSSQTGDTNLESLEDAGKYIGMLERLFVFAFVITNNWEAIGFLLAAKSVFRFGDLKESKDRKLTEYILIGTLVSFGMAMLTGLVYMQ